MTKKLQLHIPLPCHETWDNMTPVEKGKFCTSCQKAVIDFTEMSDEQVITFFKKPSTGSVCGRFQENQLNRNMQMPRKTFPLIKYFFQFTLPAFLISMKADAQRQKTGKIAAVCISEIKGDTIIKATTDFISVPQPIRGKVTDPDGMPVVGASVIIKGTHRGVTTDASGNFSILPEPSNYFTTLIIQSVGFRTLEKIVNASENGPLTVTTMKLEPQMSGEIVIVGGAFSTHRRSRKRVKLAETKIACTKAGLKDSIIAPFVKFSVYPNPVISGQTITIANNKLADDNYKIEIINSAGQIVHQQQLAISGKQKLNLNIPFVTAGSYFLKLTGEKSLKIYSEKIIIQ